MNVRDKELAVKCRLLTKHTGGIYTDSLQEFADLIRADDREALIRYFEGHWRADDREALIRYFDGHWRDEWSEGQIIEALEARGNT